MSTDTYTAAMTLRHAEPQHRAALDAAAQPVSVHQPVSDEWLGMLGQRVTVEEGIGTRRRPVDEAAPSRVAKIAEGVYV